MSSLARLLVTLGLLLPLSAPAAVVLMYHHVSEETPASTSVAPAQFADHLQRLSDNGFRVLPLDELVEAVRQGLDPSEKVAAITFDDGYRSVYDTALPMLEERGWSGAVFVSTAGVREGWREMMTPEMLRDTRERGHLVLNHTVSHPHMVRGHDEESRDAWRRRMREEILAAQRQLEQWLGAAPPRYLAWPYGEHTPALRGLARDLDFIAFGQQSGALGRYTDWQQVPRIPVNRHYAGWSSLGNKVLGLPLPVTGVEPDSGVTGEARPELVLRLEGDWTGRINCFVGGGKADTRARLEGGETVLRVRSGDDLGPGRHRYNCTAPAAEGRYYWYSWLWMRRDGSRWYAES